MANADFWRDLAAQFSNLPDDDGAFEIEWHVHADESRIRWTPSATGETWEQFKALATLAVSPLDPGSGGFETWLSLLKDSMPATSIVSVRRHNSDETTLEFKEGTIPHACAASALRCRVLEAEARGKIPCSNYTRTLLSAEAVKRIETAKREADKFTWEAQAIIDRRGIDLVSREAEIKEQGGRFKSAEFLIQAIRLEYSRLKLSAYEYEICINREIESIWKQAKLHYSERRLLESKYSSQAELHADQPTARTVAEESVDESASSGFERL